MNIAGHKVGLNHPPFIIAEMSGNHNQSLERALDIVREAANSGVQAIKLQTYKPESITLNIQGGDFEIKDKNSLWYGKNLYDLYKIGSTPWEWHYEIIKEAKKLGLICFSSPFDEAAVDFLEEMDMPAYKIASFENNHLPLIRKVASTGKPLIISTGMAKLSDIENAVITAKEAGSKDIALLKCTSSYPSSPKDSNIRTIPNLREIFNCEIGLSDHTKGLGVSIASIAMGSTIIERHFTISRSDGGVDSEFSLEPSEMKSLVDETYRAWQSLGKVNYGPTEDEMKSLIFRRSIYVAEDIKKGDTFHDKNIKIVRPGFGECPSLYEKIIGKKANKDFKKGTPLKLENIIT